MKRLIKVVKRNKELGVQVPAEALFVGSRARWSKGIRSWVAESQQRKRVKTLASFDSLFKTELPTTDNAQ